MLGHQSHQSQQNSLFKKGMTLDQYLNQMQTLKPGSEVEQKAEQDLYATSKKNEQSLSKKIITYEIRESQEDQYDQSHDDLNVANENFKLSIQLGIKQHRLSNKNILLDIPSGKAKDSFSNSRGFRVRKQSNSPFNHHKKDSNSISPNKNFAITLFNGEWRNHKDPNIRAGNPSNTLYGKFLKGIKQLEESKQKNNSKEKYFQKKNTQEMQHILKYQKDIQQKYNRGGMPAQGLDMRIQGITDRLHDRRMVSIKTHK